MVISPPNDDLSSDNCSTIEAARMLGLAVRSVQLMVDRGELEAWKTPGGHRRISRASLRAWIDRRGQTGSAAPPQTSDPILREGRPPRVLLIEDSAHYQNLVGLLVRQALPQVELHVAEDGIAGLAMAGKLDPELLIIDILLPGIDGATLIASLRSHQQFQRMSLMVVTSLEGSQRDPYAFALQGLPVVHKTRLVAELPRLLERWHLGLPRRGG
ncbi:MAG: helix-turn-helix domain-containing protein [Rubrivivax sp.]|nr:helix-turn-helix domain-containing protein [Rubrivivax sp.]